MNTGGGAGQRADSGPQVFAVVSEEGLVGPAPVEAEKGLQEEMGCDTASAKTGSAPVGH